MTFRVVISWLPIINSGMAAASGAMAASVKVRDRMDDFIADIAKQSRWAMLTGVLSMFAASAQILDKWLPPQG